MAMGKPCFDRTVGGVNETVTVALGRDVVNWLIAGLEMLRVYKEQPDDELLAAIKILEGSMLVSVIVSRDALSDEQR